MVETYTAGMATAVQYQLPINPRAPQLVQIFVTHLLILQDTSLKAKLRVASSGLIEMQPCHEPTSAVCVETVPLKIKLKGAKKFESDILMRP